MQHVEEAGVHSGDSACVLPPMSLGEEMLAEIRETTSRIALELGVVGLINIQYAVAGGQLYVLEANPRASRTVPFVSKAIGAPLAKIACRLMLGEALADQELPEAPSDHVSVKEAVLPFARFAGADSVLGPEMKSTGEVMGIASDFPTAFGKAQSAAGIALPRAGTVFITVTDTDKPAATQLAARFHDLGFRIIATRGTAQAISRMGVPVKGINKIAEGSPHVVDFIRNREVDLVINTPTGSGARSDGYEIRTAAVRQGVPCVTTMTGASAAARAIFAQRDRPSVVILGSGPNRIGQGIEFDYCCVHAAMTVRESGRDAVMINCNPETVSTDYDTSDRLYFEPLTAEDVLAVIEAERPEGVVVQFGGQTPLKLARALEEAGARLLGTPVEAIDLAEDRGRFGALLRRLGIAHPPYGTALSADEAAVIAEEVGFPLLVRPSYVSGAGRWRSATRPRGWPPTWSRT